MPFKSSLYADVSQIRSEGPFSTLGEQLREIVRAARFSGNGPDERLVKINEMHERASTLGGSEMVPSDGGFLIQPEFSGEIVRRMYNTGDIFKLCTQFGIKGSNAFSFPQFDEGSRQNGSRLGGIQTYWVNEAQEVKPPASIIGIEKSLKPTFNKTVITAEKLAGFLYLTDELDKDTDALGSWATYAFSQELMFAVENCIINGTGAGQPLGVMKAPCLLSIAKESGQAAGSVVSANFGKMLAAFWAKSYNSSGAIVIYNQQLLTQLTSLTTVVGAAGSESNLWQWAPFGDEPDRLGGFPAFMSEYCQNPGTPGDIILADFSRYALAIREMMRAEVSIHLRFLQDENAFRFIMRIGGQPIDRSQIQINYSSPPAFSSPFVALGQR